MVVDAQAPIFNQLQIEYLSKEIWRRQLKHLKTAKLRRIARELGIKGWPKYDRWSLIDAILDQPYDTLEISLDNLQ